MKIACIGGGPAVSRRAPAKVNLHLEVLGRRPDGFHELETLMVAVNLFDTLEFRPAEEWRLSCSDPANFWRLKSRTPGTRASGAKWRKGIDR